MAKKPRKRKSKQERLKKRREYYQKNRERIRARDNISAAKYRKTEARKQAVKRSREKKLYEVVRPKEDAVDSATKRKNNKTQKEGNHG